ncbi:MAG: histidinol dehydrogenase [Cenarchaeum sp. SB0661_bin_35]|nr:histidinol dehydrogenase [Cenarchaeum sp. SB0667_bin_13]MXZ93828.1 histidinol dehydrogenase [Cenarchaeum sp. SB0666_bin_15]MYC80046.1 histidinol dehydrogenase [Cenarchaeum sp. SB0661_bin_35]MYD58833.1 histidinol dehydrogenase [Cenarchaeum sp. SB0678_bin_8]MYI51556.1 histidinol dehydrogenase [Cenarchaeum sp. SB0673_bin_9]MYJ28030.1 histidinol dehydrogenase [Cenarchaeum sp. SB0672_bin_9]
MVCHKHHNPQGRLPQTGTPPLPIGSRTGSPRTPPSAGYRKLIRILEYGDAAALYKPPIIISDTVKDIVQNIRERGDEALCKYERQFTGHTGPLLVSDDDIKAAYDVIPSNIYDTIKKMTDTLRNSEHILYETLNSIPASCMMREFLPIHSVGCYVPGGQARYPSSAVMSIIPAAVSGVPDIVVTSPPPIDAATIVAAHYCGAHRIYQTGGAQAVAALAYGTETIRPVDKIVGPGGSIVSQAKRLVSDVVSIDMDAGPTELGIVADADASPDLVALDMISQAEHSRDTFCFLLTDSHDMAECVSNRIESRLHNIERSDIIRDSLYNNGFIVVCDTIYGALKMAERLAPEHLQIMTTNPRQDALHVQSPGLILLGHDTPSAASDYMLGTNHILPTNRQGRTRGPLSVLDFVKMKVTVQVDYKHLAQAAPHIQNITASEGLYNHYEAVRSRIQ